jgi:murein DD-endopeptidase MepM/ murein hydrolase activator NlpD
MRKQIHFLILGNNGASARQFSLSKPTLVLFSIVALAVAAGSGWVAFDYTRLKKQSLLAETYQSQVADHLSELAQQRAQIQRFAEDINTLKAKIVGLNAFERKIRVIANLETDTGKDEGLFGLGGIVPSDLDAGLPLEERHGALVREMHGQMAQLADAADQQRISFKTLFGRLEDQVNLLACTPAIRPTTGWVTSRFGKRVSPFTGRKEFHKALDIATSKGTPIVAPADGVVSWVGRKRLFGRMLVINHGHGMMTRFAHLHKAYKKVGEKVKRGDKIAAVGATGRTTGPHLHYEVHLNGVPVNPEKYILN